MLLIIDIMKNNFLKSEENKSVLALTSTNPNPNPPSQTDIELTCIFNRFTLSFSDGDGVDPYHLFSRYKRGFKSTYATYAPLFQLEFRTAKIEFQSKNSETTIMINSDFYAFNDKRGKDNHFENIINPNLSQLISKGELIEDSFQLSLQTKPNSPTSIVINFVNPELILVMDAWIDIAIYFLILNPEIDTLLQTLNKITNPNNINLPPPTPSPTVSFSILNSYFYSMIYINH